MAAPLQHGQYSAGGDGSPITVAFDDVTEGSALVVAVSFSLSGAPVLGVSDDVNGAWTPLVRADDVSANQGCAIFGLADSAAGDLTVSFASAPGRYLCMFAAEFPGADPTSPFADAAGTAYAHPGPTTADGISSGELTLASGTGTLFALALDNYTGDEPEVGTGLTSISTAWGFDNSSSPGTYARAGYGDVAAGDHEALFTGSSSGANGGNGITVVAVLIKDASGGGPVTFDPGMATETETAYGLSWSVAHSLAVGRADESDTAFALALTKSVPVGMAATIDLAHAPSAFVKTLSVGRAEETNVALSTFAGGLAVGRADESDTALALALTKTLVVGRADEVGVALAPSAFVKKLSVGQAVESDTALALTRTKTLVVGRADEVGVALAPSIVAGFGYGLAVEADAALALTLTKALVVGTAAETGVALAPSAFVKTLSVGQAVEAGLALRPAPFAKAMAVGRADESDTALALTFAGVTFVNVGRADESCVAFAPASFAKALVVGTAAETGVALAPSAFVKTLSVGRAEETNVAFSTFGVDVIEVGVAVSTEVALPLRWRPTPAQQWAAFKRWTASLGQTHPGD